MNCITLMLISSSYHFILGIYYLSKLEFVDIEFMNKKNLNYLYFMMINSVVSISHLIQYILPNQLYILNETTNYKIFYMEWLEWYITLPLISLMILNNLNLIYIYITLFIILNCLNCMIIFGLIGGLISSLYLSNIFILLSFLFLLLMWLFEYCLFNIYLKNDDKKTSILVISIKNTIYALYGLVFYIYGQDESHVYIFMLLDLLLKTVLMLVYYNIVINNNQIINKYINNINNNISYGNNINNYNYNT